MIISSRLLMLILLPCAFLSASGTACAQETGQRPYARVDAPLTHVLELRAEAEVESVLIRLKDVVRPIGTPPPQWSALADSAIGLLPPDGRRLRMERQRIAETIARSGILTHQVRWTGPDTVAIRYVEPKPVAQTTSGSSLANTDITSTHNTLALQTASQPAFANTTVAPASYSEPTTPVLPAERNRIERLILNAFRGSHATLLEQYEVTLDTNDSSFAKLNGLRGVQSLRLEEAPTAGSIAIAVEGEMEHRPVSATIKLLFTELPQVVVPKQNLNRGDIVSARDLTLVHIPRNRHASHMATDVSDLVGMEVVRPIPRDRPITLDDVAEPIIIDRNDLVELRVVGAGVTISTSAKALAPAAEGDSVTVEVESPKRRLIGRAVAPGIVEIVTRPPQLSEGIQ